MPFGCRNAPAVFQVMMDRTLHSVLFKYCFAYIDDVVVFGHTIAEVLERTQVVCDLLFAEGLKLGGLKCKFLLNKV